MNAPDSRTRLANPLLPDTVAGRMELRTGGMGKRILRACSVHRMLLMGHPSRRPSMAGHRLKITAYLNRNP